MKSGDNSEMYVVAFTTSNWMLLQRQSFCVPTRDGLKKTRRNDSEVAKKNIYLSCQESTYVANKSISQFGES